MRHPAAPLLLSLVLTLGAGLVTLAQAPAGMRALSSAQPDAAPVRSATVTPTVGPIPGLRLRMPDGITLTPLAHGSADEWPWESPEDAAPRLVLQEVWFAPQGEADSSIVGFIPEIYDLIYVEAGEIVLEDGSGLRSTLRQGEFTTLEPGRWSLLNETPEPTLLLRLILVYATNSTVFDNDPNPVSLIGFDVMTAESAVLPPPPRLFFIAETHWAPGAEFPDHAFAGPVGLLTRSGRLTVVRASGASVELPPGQFVFFEAGERNQERNAETEPAVVLMVGMVTVGEDLVIPVADA